MSKMFDSAIILILLFSGLRFASTLQEDLGAIEVNNVDVTDLQRNDILPSSPTPLQDGNLLDFELANSFLEMKKRMSAFGESPNDPTMEEIAIPESNPIFTAFNKDDNEGQTKVSGKKKHHNKHSKFGTFGDLSPDLVGEDVVVKLRQVGKSRVQMGYNGTMDGFKNQGEYLPWMLLTESTPSGGDRTDTSFTDTPLVPTSDPLFIPPIDSVHVLPLKPVLSKDLFGHCLDKVLHVGHYVCFGYPSGCIEEHHCRMAVSLAIDPNNKDEILVTMAATAPRGFVAVGFSRDRFMGDDVVVHCNNIPKTKWMTLHLSINDNNFFSKVQSNEDNFVRDFTPLQGYAQDNGVITCEFKMKTKIHPDDPVSFLGKSDGGEARLFRRSADQDEGDGDDITEFARHIFLAFGRHSEEMDPNSTEFGQLKFHHLTAVSHEEDDTESIKKMFTHGQLLPPRDNQFILMHIIPYTMAFSFFLPCAIFIGKYGREAYGKEETGIFGLPHWLAIHVTFEHIAVILSIIGLVGILSEVGGMWRCTYFWPTVHCVGGLIATVALWINFLLGWIGYFIKSKNTVIDKTNHESEEDSDTDIHQTTEKFQLSYNYFKWAHWAIGNVIFWFGMTCLVLAYQMRRAHMPCVFMYIAVLQILIHVLTHIVMMIHTSWLVKHLDGLHWRRRVYPGPMIAWKKEQMSKKYLAIDDTDFSDLPIWCGRRRSVIFYFIISLLCCIGLIGLMIVPMVLCRQTFTKTPPSQEE